LNRPPTIRTAAELPKLLDLDIGGSIESRLRLPPPPPPEPAVLLCPDDLEIGEGGNWKELRDTPVDSLRPEPGGLVGAPLDASIKLSISNGRNVEEGIVDIFP